MNALQVNNNPLKIKKKPKENTPSLLPIVKKNYLQLLLPFINEICGILNYSKIIPSWFYDRYSKTFWKKIISNLIDGLAIVGIVWYSAEHSNNSKTPLPSILIGLGVIILAYIIPNLFLYDFISNIKYKKLALFAGLSFIGFLVFIEIIWTKIIQSYTYKFKDLDKEKVEKITYNLLAFFIIIIITILFSTVLYNADLKLRDIIIILAIASTIITILIYYIKKNIVKKLKEIETEKNIAKV